jgi:hypothetical protein
MSWALTIPTTQTNSERITIQRSLALLPVEVAPGSRSGSDHGTEKPDTDTLQADFKRFHKREHHLPGNLRPFICRFGHLHPFVSEFGWS